MSVRSPGIAVDLIESRSGWFSSLPQVAALLSLALGSVVLLGRAFDLSILHGLLPGITTIKSSAATSFILGGGSLLMLVRGREAYLWARIFAAGLLVLMTVAWVGVGWRKPA